jgi:hypothetical protein
MPFISSRIFVAGGTKKLITLQNEEHVRYIGSDWLGLRIGILCALTDNAGGNVVGRLGIGACSGQTNPLGNPTNTTNFIGFRNLSPTTWTYTANSGDPYFTSGTFYGLNRAGNTDTTAGVGSTNVNIVTTAPGNGGLQRRSLIIVDLNRTTGNINSFYTSTAQFNADYTVGDLLMAVENNAINNTPVFRGTTMSAGTQQNIGMSPVPGAFDSVDVHWSGTAQALEIYGMAVYRKL